MTAPTFPLIALAERCEQAFEPDRELDAAIVAAVTLGVVGMGDEKPDDDWCNRLYRWEPPRAWADSWLPVPRYTASLDEAVKLIPAGWKWSLDWTQQAPYQDSSWASAFAPGSGRNPADTEASAMTPALALCAVALRARAAMEATP